MKIGKFSTKGICDFDGVLTIITYTGSFEYIAEIFWSWEQKGDMCLLFLKAIS